MVLEKQIRFLKDRVTLKTGAIAAENQLIYRNKLHLKNYLNSET